MRFQFRLYDQCFLDTFRTFDLADYSRKSKSAFWYILKLLKKRNNAIFADFFYIISIAVLPKIAKGSLISLKGNHPLRAPLSSLGAISKNL